MTSSQEMERAPFLQPRSLHEAHKCRTFVVIRYIFWHQLMLTNGMEIKLYIRDGVTWYGSFIKCLLAECRSLLCQQVCQSVVSILFSLNRRASVTADYAVNKTQEKNSQTAESELYIDYTLVSCDDGQRCRRLPAHTTENKCNTVT